MPLNRRDRGGERKKAQMVGLAIVLVVILLETVLPALIGWVRYGIHRVPVMEPGASVTTTGGGMLAVLVVILLGLGIAVGVLFALSRRKRRGGEVMHDDHYRRAGREHPHYSADPCAYSEGYSRRKSRRYDDPWDF